MKRLAGYPHWFFPVLITSLTVLLCTGIALIPTMLEMRLDQEVPIQLSGEVRLLMAAGHTAVSFAVVAFIGALMTIHVRTGWQRQLNRISGVSLLALVALLLASCIGIFYSGDELLSQASSLFHCLAGLLALPLFGWHLYAGMRGRRELVRT